jgi:hypothetical protein
MKFVWLKSLEVFLNCAKTVYFLRSLYIVQDKLGLVRIFYICTYGGHDLSCNPVDIGTYEQ